MAEPWGSSSNEVETGQIWVCFSCGKRLFIRYLFASSDEEANDIHSAVVMANPRQAVPAMMWDTAGPTMCGPVRPEESPCAPKKNAARN
ncbi:hypothetical protein [Pseudomonas sp.]|uniref:hypothetical protein n=1 Tax=Pseudomonas sp. TaxID=306 RepID=UPI00291322D1|nr:hypothetical protein [Pseudomonas sp.]MDU4252207.1 hypothetical protein [Pseudomonas sp.]